MADIDALIEGVTVSEDAIVDVQKQYVAGDATHMEVHAAAVELVDKVRGSVWCRGRGAFGTLPSE